MTYGTPQSAAINGIAAAGYTDKVDPSATTRSASRAAALARSRLAGESDCPKLIVAGLSRPPQPPTGRPPGALNPAKTGPRCARSGPHLPPPTQPPPSIPTPRHA